MKVFKNNIISIHYIVTDDDGVVVDSNTNFAPLQYLQGAGNILPSLEHQLEGAIETEVRKITLMPHQAYGNYNNGLVAAIDKNNFPDSDNTLQPGMMLIMSGGREVEVLEVLPDKIIVNGNHPLAGKQLHFTVTIEEIRPATDKELLSGQSLEADEICGPNCSCYVST